MSESEEFERIVQICFFRIVRELQANKLPLRGIEFVSDANGNVLASSLGSVFVNCAGAVPFEKEQPTHATIVGIFSI